MNIKEAGEKYLQPLVSLIEGEHHQKTFEKYISSLMLKNNNFSTYEINEKTEERAFTTLLFS